ncbi:WD40-repeat-containing domain protein [Entophlyctis helioformis]|nr:WD40-repeat-containing domain protein [Entophlyctis helioformis]
MTTKSKVSCLSFNSYVKSYLLASDYDGIVGLWDTATGTSITLFKEHEKRVWSVDFSLADPMRIASGGDDMKVKLWSVNQRHSFATIDAKSNVCSVKFHPTFTNHVAIGSADHHAHYYDLRNLSAPVHVFKGHRKAVSYVKFLNNHEMVTASTDCTLRLWSLRDGVTGTAGKSGVLPGNKPDMSGILEAGSQFGWIGDDALQGGQDGENSNCIRSFSGHSNEKNFVGLAINCDSEFLACGSETNEMFTYYHQLSRPVLKHSFGTTMDRITGEMLPQTDPVQFVSSVCWKRKTGNVLAAANSQGQIRVLELVE